MTLAMNLKIVGVLLMALGLSHMFFNRYFGVTGNFMFNDLGITAGSKLI